VAKLQYDPQNPNYAILRQAVFARLRQGWPQVEDANFEAQRLRDGFAQFVDFINVPPYWGGQLFQDVYDVLWQLVVEGVIHPGNRSMPNFPGFTLTEYGKRILDNENAHPHDVERFLTRIKKGQQLDPTTEAYLVESLHSFRQNRLVASAILLGVTAERVFLLISEALLEALQSLNEQQELKKAMDLRAMKPKQDWVHKKLEELDKSRKKLGNDFLESTPLMVTGIYDLIRQQRNDLGHPRDAPPKIDREHLEASFILFAGFYGTTEKLRLYLATHRASL
jgi:hypothetical protein